MPTSLSTAGETILCTVPSLFLPPRSLTALVELLCCLLFFRHLPMHVRTDWGTRRSTLHKLWPHLINLQCSPHFLPGLLLGAVLGVLWPKLPVQLEPPDHKSVCTGTIHAEMLYPHPYKSTNILSRHVYYPHISCSPHSFCRTKPKTLKRTVAPWKPKCPLPNGPGWKRCSMREATSSTLAPGKIPQGGPLLKSQPLSSPAHIVNKHRW